ncbi:uncharacterized protein [Haliotis asinina]|uniref:uncharacterized protein n=1 Tax=Haliotis asinina TaxID=109174 RepID=UPI00353214C8
MPDFDNKRVAEGLIWSEKEVDTRLICVRRCMKDDQCMMVGYTPDSGQCRGYNVDVRSTYPDKVTTVDEPGFSMYVMCRVLDFVGKTCNTSSDCLGDRSVCESGQCLCEIGYSHSRHKGYDTCNIDCDKYGSTFTAYSGRAIYYYNTKTYSGFNVASCKQFCLSETTFLCKSYEYNFDTGKCNIMSFSWLDRSTEDHRDIPNLSESTCSPSCRVKTMPDFDNKRVAEGLIWSVEKVDTRLICVRSCIKDDQCMMVGYTPDSGQCRGYNVDVRSTSSNNVTTVDEPGFNMYVMCRALDFVGKTCNTSSDCLGDRSVCESGQCLCEIGYSHSRHKGYDTCNIGCDKYGSTFTAYPGRAIFLYNTKSYNGFSISSCKQFCLSETTFLCRSYEYSFDTEKCNIMSFSWLDRDIEDHRDNPDFTFYTRDCKL